jgi:hypothetical protein
MVRHVRSELPDTRDHKIELLLAVNLRRVKCDLCWGQSENEPTAAHIDIGEFQYIAKKCSIGLRINAVDD